MQAQAKPKSTTNLTKVAIRVVLRLRFVWLRFSTSDKSYDRMRFETVKNLRSDSYDRLELLGCVRRKRCITIPLTCMTNNIRQFDSPATITPNTFRTRSMRHV